MSGGDNNNSEPVEKKLKTKRKYNQKFRDIWKEQYHWIEHQNGKPYCTICCIPVPANKSHLKRHNESLRHKNLVKALRSQPKLDEKKEELKARRCKLKIAELQILMFIIEHNLPFVLIDSLVLLIKSVASDSLLVKELQMGRTKATETTCGILLEESNSIISNILQTQKFSLIIDETTDISTTKCLALIVRFYDFKIKKVRDRFLALIALNTADSKAIFEAIVNLFDSLKIPFENLVGFASDNAAVMIGHFNGVKKLLLEKNPHIFSMRCICHSLHLMSSAAAKSIPHKIEILARNIYFYFSHSPKKQGILKEFQENFNVKPHKILKLAGTRWLSLENVINRILEQWDPLRHFFLLTSFENETNADLASKISADLNDENKFFMIFLSYILNLTNKTNLVFQSELPQIQNLIKTLSSFYKIVLSNFIKKEFITEENFKNINFENSSYFKDVKDVYVGPKAELFLKKMNFSTKHIIELKKACRNYYLILCQQCKERFDWSNRQLLALQDIDPLNLAESATTLISEFPNLVEECDVDTIDFEWRSLLYQYQPFISKDLECSTFWSNVFDMKNSLNEKMFPNLTKFISALLCLPHSSASAERTFSQLTLIKTNKRNCLDVSTINAILASKELIDKIPCHEWKPTKNLIKNYIKK